MSQDMQSTRLIRAHSSPVPRYTSYPTAPHFCSDIGAADYGEWLATLPAGASLSLYVHIPFCHSLCWYCGCNTQASRRYEPVAPYLAALRREIDNVALAVGTGHRVVHIHWGGGSPNFLHSDDVEKLADALRQGFGFGGEPEFAIELDPRYLTEHQVAGLRRAGVSRVSFGVQDFDETVQVSINRQQSFAVTRHAVDLCRRAGIASINIDLVYGLPHQTRASISETVEKVIELAPDRLAVFGYAHLPARFKHQRLIDDDTLPDVVERYAQSLRVARRLVAAGYAQVGINHFAKSGDALTGLKVRRNFQGYTTDGGDVLIGLGASAIGKPGKGYVQNAVTRGDYMRRIGEFGFATVRGKTLTTNDRIRAHVIERLMCDLEFDGTDLARRFGEAAATVLTEAEDLLQADTDGLVARTALGFRITPAGRPFARSICSAFDSYLQRGGGFSIGV